FVTNPAEDSVLVFDRNASTGALTLAQVVTDDLNNVKGLEGVTTIGLSADGKYVFAAGTGENTIAVFGRDATDGSLVQLSTFTHADVDGPMAIAITSESNGNYLYVSSSERDAVVVLTWNESGLLSHLQTVRDGFNGVDGLAGAAGLELSTEDRKSTRLNSSHV